MTDLTRTRCLSKKVDAKKLRLHGWPVSQFVQVAGKPWEEWNTTAYHVPLQERGGKIHQVTCFSIKSMAIEGIVHHFSMINPINLQRPSGTVDLLLGLNHAEIHP